MEIEKQRGETEASWPDHILGEVYDDLRRLAYAKLAQEKPGQTLQATSLVHEAYLRLMDQDDPGSWDNPGHFFAAAAEAMRRILIERARRKKCVKHGAGRRQISLEDADREQRFVQSPEESLALDDALRLLEADDPKASQVAKLRIFAGMSLEESAQALGLTRTTAFRSWAYARAFMLHEMQDSRD